MNKVGIVTVYKNINYGSKLQNYAMQNKLKSLGYESENILVKTKSNRKVESKFLRLAKNPSLFLEYIQKKYLKEKLLTKRKAMFDKYLHDFINESKYLAEDVKNLNCENIYYKYICGSDQIWAPNQFNENFFLSFVNDKSKKIAYAPSIGLPVIPEHLILKYRELITNIGFLSIREKDGANLIKEITEREAKVVLDPTLLLTKDEWLEHAKGIKIEEPYILCYLLGTNKEHRKWIEKLSKKTGYKIVVLPFVTRDFYWGNKQAFEIGPQEYLGLIDGAEIVCTDSYHGMLFSLNFNKEFYSFLRFKEGDSLNQNSRVLNLVEKLDLKDRVVDLNSSNKYNPINWESVNSLIAVEREKSEKYLKESLAER